MNSIFSSFDALSAELLGRKFSSPFASASILSLKAKSDGESPAAGGQPPEQQRSGKKIAQRFAPELDGLNCFETLVRY